MNDYGQPKKRRNFLPAFLGALIGGLIVAIAMLLGLNALGMLNTGKTTEVVGGKNVIVNDIDVDSQIEAVAATVPESVVSVQTTLTQNSYFGSTEATGFGSGFIVTSDGYIVTNQHVISDDPTTIKVSLEDGSEYEGKIIWSDASLDLAVIKIDASALTAVTLGNSDEIQIGQTAIAIGNPLGLGFERSVTSGIVSALNRSLVVDQSMVSEDLIQTDASINQGNSGGPLLNGAGEVIGINTYKASQGEGIGFAIPINIVKPIVSEIVASGSFTPMVLGITGYDKQQAAYFIDNVTLENGIYVESVQVGGGADKAGLRQGDVILKVDGQDVNTMLKLKEILYSHHAGDKVSVTYERGGNNQTVEIEIAAGQANNSR